jgi:hypothetical protein
VTHVRAGRWAHLLQPPLQLLCLTFQDSKRPLQQPSELGISRAQFETGRRRDGAFRARRRIFWNDRHKAACGALSIMTTQNQRELFAAVSAALSAELKELNAQCEKARSAETAHLRNIASH